MCGATDGWSRFLGCEAPSACHDKIHQIRVGRDPLSAETCLANGCAMTVLYSYGASPQSVIVGAVRLSWSTVMESREHDGAIDGNLVVEGATHVAGPRSIQFSRCFFDNYTAGSSDTQHATAVISILGRS